MKITAIETLPLSFKMTSEAISSRRRTTHRESLIIKVYTDEGIVGIGEANPSPLKNLRVLDDIVKYSLAPILIGENPLNIEQLWEKMYRHTFTFGRRGVVIIAISGIDIALWDIFGKVTGQPIYRLLGGKFRSRVKAYASGLYMQPLEKLADEAKSYVDQGFRAVKQRVGAGLKTDLELVKTVRNAIGEDIDLMVDACTGWSPLTIEDWNLRTQVEEGSHSLISVLRIAREMEQFNLTWIEEPLPPDDIDTLKELAAKIDTPIALGENLFTRYEFREFIEKKAVDILQPDVTRCGGITEVRRICALASAWNIPCAPHSWGSVIALTTNVHLITAIPNAVCVEYDMIESPLRDELAKEQIKPVEGYIMPPEEPGLGINLNTEVIEKYLKRV